MKNQLNILGIVGARSGSKGVADKNIRPLSGKPLMAWIIEAAKRSTYVNRVVVSTDSPQYAEIARRFGAEAPVLRPVVISQDQSLDIEYIKHMVSWLRKNEGYYPDIILRMQPTSPLQKPEDIDACIQLLLDDPEAHASVIVTEARQHPEKALKLIDDGKGGTYLVTHATGSGRGVTPGLRQNHEKAYFRANTIATRIATLDDFDSLTGDRVRPHIIPQEAAVDIDSENDFILAEYLIKRYRL